MATYIPNVTDIFPEIQPFRPDYSFLQSALQYKQGKYDTALNQLNSAYSSIVNAPLTYGDNVRRRDEFIKSADAELKKIASLDLSLPQNVQLANNIFKPFYEDEDIVYDMVFTKKAQKALQEGEQFKNCLTGDCEGKYSPESMKAINYRLTEFRNAASMDEAKKVPAPEYVPFVNIFKEAEKVLGEKFTDISIDEKSGGYIVTTKNGPKAFNTILQQLSSTLGVDPRVKRYAQNKAYVESMDGVYSLAQSKYDGDIAQAKNEYFSIAAVDAIKNDESNVQSLQKVLDDVESKLDMYNAKLNNGGKLNQKQAAEYEQLSRQKSIYDANMSSTQNRIRILGQSLQEGNISFLESAINQSLAANNISKDIRTEAEIQAYKNYQVKMGADPYEKSRFDKSLDWEYKKMEKELDFQYKQKEKQLEEGDYDNFFATPTTTEAGQIEQNILNEDRTVYNQTWKAYGDDLSSVVKGVSNISDPNIKNAVNKLLSSEGITIADLQSGRLGTSKLRAVHSKVTDLLSRYPELNQSISGPLRKANDTRQMLNATDVAIARNNKAVVNNMIADKSTSVADRELLDVMFGNSGRLKDKNTAYNEYVSKNGTQKLIAIRNNSFMGRELADLQSLLGLNNTPEEVFSKMYDAAKEDFDEKYTNYALNNQSYITVGGIGIGGGGGVTTDYVINGIANAKRPKSKQTLALYDIAQNLQGAKVALGTPSEIRAASDDDFEDIAENEDVKNYVNNLRMNVMRSKSPVGYQFSALGLGSKNYSTLHILPSADDPSIKMLKGSLGDEAYSDLLSKGITVVIPKANISNTYLNKNTTVNNREIILKTTGKYNYYNPKIQADITFDLQKDGTILPSGTLLDLRTKKTGFVPNDPIDFPTFNAMVFGLDNL